MPCEAHTGTSWVAQRAWVPSRPGGRTTEFWKCSPIQQRVFLLSASCHGATQVSGILLTAMQGVFGKSKHVAGVWRLPLLSWQDILPASAPMADPRTGHDVNPCHSHSWCIAQQRARVWVGRQQGCAQMSSPHLSPTCNPSSGNQRQPKCKTSRVRNQETFEFKRAGKPMGHVHPIP